MTCILKRKQAHDFLDMSRKSHACFLFGKLIKCINLKLTLSCSLVYLTANPCLLLLWSSCHNLLTKTTWIGDLTSCNSNPFLLVSLCNASTFKSILSCSPEFLIAHPHFPLLSVSYGLPYWYLFRTYTSYAIPVGIELLLSVDHFHTILLALPTFCLCVYSCKKLSGKCPCLLKICVLCDMQWWYTNAHFRWDLDPYP